LSSHEKIIIKKMKEPKTKQGEHIKSM